WRS
ncbi:hypothetical protein AB1N83_012921, partial [Pleurotus pulmonarius]